MNRPITPELSLYQLTQTVDPSPPSLTVKTNTFRNWLKTLIQFLIEQKIQATIWVKLPTNPRWWSVIEAYQQEGLAEKIYLCSISRNPDSSPRANLPQNNIIPIEIEGSSQLKREYFCLILSPQLCSLILVQKQPPSEKKPHNGVESSLLNLVYSFDPIVIQQVLRGIKQVITITDTTPEEMLTDFVLPFPLPSTLEASLLTQLLHRYLHASESNPVSSHASEESTSQPQLTANFLQFGVEFLNSLTRELSVPLTNMKTALLLLESKQHKREDRQRYLDLLKGECDRQNSLISSLQELVNLSQPVEPGDICVNLEEVVPGIVSTYQAIAEEKGIVLGYTIPPGVTPVFCPSSWLRNILHNLIHNSLKFTPSKGQILVKAAIRPEWVELWISDTGIGIEHSDLSKIFDSFYRGRNTLGEDTGGTGLGLAIVRQLVEQCGGQINVTSQLRKGTVFKITLPVVVSL